MRVSLITVFLPQFSMTQNSVLIPGLVGLYGIGVNLDQNNMQFVYDKFGLEPGTQDFIGHAMALYLDDR